MIGGSGNRDAPPANDVAMRRFCIMSSRLRSRSAVMALRRPCGLVPLFFRFAPGRRRRPPRVFPRGLVVVPVSVSVSVSVPVPVAVPVAVPVPVSVPFGLSYDERVVVVVRIFLLVAFGVFAAGASPDRAGSGLPPRRARRCPRPRTPPPSVA